MSAHRTWQIHSLLRTVDPNVMARRAGDRLLQLAAGLAMRRTAVEVRLHLAPLNEMAMQLALHETRDAVQAADPFPHTLYQGMPVAARLLVGHRQDLSPWLRAALLDRGVGLALTTLALTTLDVADPDTVAAWQGDRTALLSVGLPFGAAQCLTVAEAPTEVQRRSGELYGLPDPQEAILTCDALTGEQGVEERPQTSSYLDEWLARRSKA